MNKFTKEEIMKYAVDKREKYATTTKKFKSDLIDFFIDKDLDIIAEVSGWGGHTTKILSYLFNKVLFIETPVDFENRVMKKPNGAYYYLRDRDNVEFIPLDVYNVKCEECNEPHSCFHQNKMMTPKDWGLPLLDALFVDCIHTYVHTKSDINNGLNFLKKGSYLIFDDYSFKEDNFGTRRAIHEAMVDEQIEFVSYIGEKMENSGFEEPITYKDLDKSYEGVICKKL